MKKACLVLLLAAFGLVACKETPLVPPSHYATRELLDKAARTASRMGHAISYQPSAMVPNGLYNAQSPLDQSVSYKRYLHRIPVAIFWSVTVYDPITGSGSTTANRFRH